METSDIVGWLATVAFTASYFFHEWRLRLMQMLGAGIWLVYGVLLGEPPIIVANSIVLVTVTLTSWKQRRAAGRV